MASCVSLVAIFAIAGIGAVFAEPWAEVVAKAGTDEREADELRGATRSYIFSFGLENASYAPAGPKGEDGGGEPR